MGARSRDPLLTSDWPRPGDHTRLDPRLVSPAAPALFCWLPKQLRGRLVRYYAGVGSQHEGGAEGDVFGKNGAINVAYISPADDTITSAPPPNTDATYM